MKTLLLKIFFFVFVIHQATAQNPFEKYDYQIEISTLSSGEFEESFMTDSLVQVGSVIMNRVTGKIVSFISYDTIYSEATLDPQIISRWMSVDPLADIAADRTPYHFVSNNPINRIDPTGLTDFALNKKTGEVTQVGDVNDEPDRILKTNRKGEVKYKKNGEAKVAMGGIEQGILADGQNWKKDDQVVNVGGEGQPSVDGVKSFTLGLSEYIGNEIKGISYSSDGSGNATDVVLGKYENNSRTESFGSPVELARKYGADYSAANVTQVFHTHPDGKLGATQSAPHLSQDVKGMQSEKQYSAPNASYIILYRIQGQSKPAEYDYTHEYRQPSIRKR